jgi:hypothetical protein
MATTGAQILTVSSREADCKFGKILALNNSIQYLEAVNAFEIQRILEKNSQSVVLLDYDFFKETPHVLDVLSKYAKPSLCFAVTDEGLSDRPELIKYPFFGNYIQRRFADPAPTFYSKLVGANIRPELDGLKPYFVHDTKINRIEIKRSSHKSMAIEALQKTLTNRGIKGRLATLVAQGVDELILNAIFDAPYSTQDQTRPRHKSSRDLEFEMTGQDIVVVEMAASDQYMGICVIDQYGSMSAQTVYQGLKPYLTNAPFEPDPFKGLSSGFGFGGILQSGLNLKIACQPGKRTEVSIFFPVNGSFKEFRGSFRFFSVVA